MVCRGIRPSLYYGAAQLPPTTSPTCRRLAPDFALFPYGLSGSAQLAVEPHQTARSRALSGSNRTGPTRWGTGFKRPTTGPLTRPLRADARRTTASRAARKKRRRYCGPLSHESRRRRARLGRGRIQTASGFKVSRHYLAGSSQTRMSAQASGIRRPSAVSPGFTRHGKPSTWQEWRLAWEP